MLLRSNKILNFKRDEITLFKVPLGCWFTFCGSSRFYYFEGVQDGKVFISRCCGRKRIEVSVQASKQLKVNKRG